MSEGLLPVDASVVVVAVEELDLLEGLLAGVVTGQVGVHAEEQVERCRSCQSTIKKKRSEIEELQECLTSTILL